MKLPVLKASSLFFFATLVGTSALAADGFKVRFPLSGTLGGEMVAPADNSGMYGSIVFTAIDIDKVTGNDGNTIKLPLAGGTINPTLPAPIGSRSATYAANLADLALTQKQPQANLILGYLSEGAYAGGKLTFVFNMPYISVDRTAALTATTPTLSALSPALPSPPLSAAQVAGTQAQVQAGFATTYQAGVAAQSTTNTGSVTGIGDTELTGAWIKSEGGTKLIAGLTLVVPTAKYDKSNPLYVGYGNFYTLRPGVAASTQMSDSWTVGGRFSVGLNTPNTDNGIRSGNFTALDVAAAYRTPVGVVGPHIIYVSQYEADQGGSLGDNKFSSTGAGLFFATLIPGINAGLNVAYMKTVDSRNALSGSFLQFRLTKAF